jgi:hypothetical protein
VELGELPQERRERRPRALLQDHDERRWDVEVADELGLLGPGAGADEEVPLELDELAQGRVA